MVHPGAYISRADEPPLPPGGAIPFEVSGLTPIDELPPSDVEAEDSTPLLGNPEALQARCRRDGFLFFRALLPLEECLEVERDFVELLHQFGWVDEAQDSELGTRTHVDATGKDYGGAEFTPFFQTFQQLESFHSLAHSPPLLGALRTLFGEEPLVHPRHIGRIVFPNRNEGKTMPHQDWIHVQGDTMTMTAWLPLGPVPRSAGGLAMLKGSSAFGLRPHYRSRRLGLLGGAGGIGAMPAPMEQQQAEWSTTDYQRGDVVLFDSLCLHQALPNLGDTIRLSLDYRYSALSQPVEVASLLPHGGAADGGWEEIYRGDMAKGPWKSDRHQYYWRQYLEDGLLKVVRKVDPPDGSSSAEWAGDVCPDPLADGPAVRHGAVNINPLSLPHSLAKL